ncbi:ABC transporter substrate-binding protein [Pyramidobacter sp.]|uniref:ABC transporter substrate-binding protein n=1 Tax=Pyramidobacter sp. TaxID=1943581 RepID=UPI0025E84308|nr:ABC transporter substrate-binding protein [Pyramidobacter sp.]MCI7403501.1 ABC transporter substrate-binding protein [Pyramidobacter sp.]MDY3213597.1 ABC transporter substrate-binding protein [Pyramidobacter sp.]
MKRYLHLLTVCAVFLALTALTGQAGAVSSDVPSESELIVAGSEIACGVDPTVYPAADYLLNMGAGEILFKAGADGIIRPSLAKEAVQLDEHSWEIRLRPEAVFWSGAPVTAEAVVASLMRSKALDMKANPHLKGMTFSAADENTVRVVTDAANVDITENLSSSQLVIHNTAAPYSYDGAESADYTGMYRIVSFEPSRRMVFEKNENYWGTKPEIQRVVHEQIGDSDARVMAALSGQYHVVMDIDRTAYKQFTENAASHIVMVPGAQTMTVYLNTEKSALSDERVRRALSWGLDRRELILLGMEGLSEPVTTWLGANPAYADIKNAFFDSYDPEKAAALLDEAGWRLEADGYRYRNGAQLAMTVRSFRNDKALGEAVQIQWRRLGVNVSVRHGDYSLMSDAYKTGDWDGAIEGWGTFGNVLGLLNTQYGANGTANYGRYRDARVDDLLARLAAAGSREERGKIARELSLHIAEKSPAVYICPRPQITAVSNKLRGFVPHFRQFENVVNANLRIVE